MRRFAVDRSTRADGFKSGHHVRQSVRRMANARRAGGAGASEAAMCRGLEPDAAAAQRARPAARIGAKFCVYLEPPNKYCEEPRLRTHSAGMPLARHLLVFDSVKTCAIFVLLLNLPSVRCAAGGRAAGNPTVAARVYTGRRRGESALTGGRGISAASPSANPAGVRWSISHALKNRHTDWLAFTELLLT